MNKIKVGVVEDELIIADHICTVLKKIGYQPLLPCISFTEALKMIDSEKPDIVLLDIMLAGQNDGVELALRIKKEYNIPFIFLTSNADRQTINRTKLLDPSAYLIKPFNKDDLFVTIEIALHNFSSRHFRSANKSDEINKQEFIFLRKNNQYVKVPFNDIVYLCSEHVYVEVVTKSDEKFLIRNTMSNIITKFPQNQFIRIHRKYVVNLFNVASFSVENIVVGDTELPLAKSFKESFYNAVLKCTSTYYFLKH